MHKGRMSKDHNSINIMDGPFSANKKLLHASDACRITNDG